MAKHAPNTCEVSTPHTSKDCPELHVDVHCYDENGNYDKTISENHITEPSMINLGQADADYRDSQKTK